jgi:type II secretory pathway pseudopilin PulG
MNYNIYKKYKKAAMFGLDARIALAIFGALSVISGAALYSAIQNAKAVKMATTISELRKAIEQFALDTGSFLPRAQAYSHKIGYLFENSDDIFNWKGPYFGTDSFNSEDITFNFTGNSIIDKDFKTTAVYGKDSSAWIYTSGTAACSESFVTNECDIFLTKRLSLSDSSVDELKNTFTLLDDYIDGGDGVNTGDVRAKEVSGYFYFYIYLMPDYQKIYSD